MKRFIVHITGLLLLLLLFQGCSTQKNTFVTRTYHKITSKYNILFNATESFNEGVEKVEQNIEDDFTRLIPVYKESDPSVGNMVKSDMENAIIKASKLIEIHSITAKPKGARRGSQRSRELALKEEYNPLVDDSYLLMGKAWYYQQNYLTAIDNLSFILRKYPEGDARYEAQVWLIKSYTEMERFAEAAEVIQAIQNEIDFPRSLEGDLAVATANYYIQQQEYAEAVKFLDIALSRVKGRNENARLQYIQAQLYEELEQPMKAAEAYRKVDKMNPDYRMAFNARIKAAGLFSDNSDVDKTKRDLRRMLRDKKNVEFRDQIYFALGNIFFREGNRDQAISNYRSSVSGSFNNPFQRALSAITLADIYFDIQNYREAQAYYDSAMIIIDDTYPNYQNLSKQYRSLTSLVENIVVVEREDSLQRVALMSESERETLIAQLMEEEQERRLDMENQALQGFTDQSDYRSNRFRMGMGTSGSGGGGWYFYNPQTVAYGKVSFQQRWGQRQLEDNWRRSNKSSVAVEDFEQVVATGDSTQPVTRVEDPLQKSFYTQDLPLTDSLMQISDDRIRNALYNMGRIYKSEFSNYQRSAEAYEELIRRFPNNIYILSAYFDLFDLYELMNDQQKSDYYKNMIISRFPESNYAQYLVNPNYFMELQARNDSLNQVYEETYRSYRRGNYQNVIALAQSLKNMQPDSLLFPKIEFMETVAQGTQSDIHNFEALLRDYVNKWPNAEPAPLATDILTLIQDSTLADYQKLVEMGYINEEIQNEELLTADKGIDDEFGGRFSYDDDFLHYFVIAYPRAANIDINRLKFDIANYNIDHYTQIDFDIETEPLNDKQNLLTVRSLGNKEEGLIYHRSIIRKAPVFQSLTDVDFVNFTISSANYRQILTENSVADYLKFFVKNYSRFIKTDFSDDDADISPEELMARARQEEQLLREKGEFRVVDTGAADQLFSSDINTTQNFILAVRDLSMDMNVIQKGFTEFNNNEYGGWNLSVELRKSGDYQLFVIRNLPSLNEAMSYFRKVVITRSLFEPLGQTTYRNFLITDENLQRVIDDGLVDDYIDYFRNYYIQKGTATPPQTHREEPVQAGPDTSDVPLAEPEEERPPAYNGPYLTEIEQPHLFVFVIPSQGVDKQQFITGIEKFNTAGAGTQLTVREVEVDEFRTAVVVDGLADRENAARYSSLVVQNRDLFVPLGNANYRNFLITPDNFKIFLEEKNITDYVDFYKQIYLKQ